MDFISGFVLGAVVAMLAVAGFAKRYMRQRNEAREEAEMWQAKFCRHNDFVVAMATIPKQRIESYSMTFSNN